MKLDLIDYVEAKNFKRGMTFELIGEECFVIHAKPNLRGKMVIHFIIIKDDGTIDEEYVRSTIPMEFIVVPLNFKLPHCLPSED